MIIDYDMTNTFALNLHVPFLFLGWSRRPLKRPRVNHPTFRVTFAGTPTGIPAIKKRIAKSLEIRRR